jgi:L-fuconolactonase
MPPAPPTPRLDAHQHFWNYSAAEYPWMRPEWPIRRDFLPEHLEPLLADAGLGGSIAVQARQSMVESRWLLELADRHALIRGVVGWVDLRDENVSVQLAELASHPKFVGVRHVVQDEPDDRFMLGPDFLRGIAQLERFDLTYDLLVFPRQLPAAIELVRRFPAQPFVLDHIAKPSIEARVLSPWREQIVELASHPNVSCKVSGMVTEANWSTWQPSDLRPYLDVVFGAFGEDRLMFGSDWPVCLLAGSYHCVHAVIREYVAGLPTTVAPKVFGRNAARAYGI